MRPTCSGRNAAANTNSNVRDDTPIVWVATPRSAKPPPPDGSASGHLSPSR